MFKEYKEENEYEGSEISRSLGDMLFNDKIVCAGYAEFLCEITRQINDTNLNIIKYSYQYNDEERHARCLVGLIDEKYNINGVFSSDPTNDSVRYDSIELNNYYYLLMDERKDKDLDIIKESILSWSSEIGNDRGLKLKFYGESGDVIGHRDDSVLIEKFKTILKNGQDYINESTILKAVKEIESKIFMPKYDIQNSNNKRNNTRIKVKLNGKSKIVNVSLKKDSGKNETINTSFKKR